jgi:HEAT repeat protein
MLRTALLVILCTLTLEAQPRILNAKLEKRTLSGALDAEIANLRTRAAQPIWIGWSVPSVSRDIQSCCWHSTDNWSWRGCELEQQRGQSTPKTNTGPVPLEPARSIHVLLRLENGQPDKLRTFSADCELDAVDTAFVWLESVSPAASIGLLSRYLNQADSDNLGRAALNAIALHNDPAAIPILDKFSAPGQSEKLRREAIRAYASLRGAAGFDAAQRVLRSSEEMPAIRESALRGLGANRDPRVLPYLLDFARKDANAKLRGTALVLAARQASRLPDGPAKVKPVLNEALASTDADPELRRRAVEAISQLPEEDSIPMLIQVARQNQNPDLRKRAMARLGESRDPRAVAFVTEILSK